MCAPQRCLSQSVLSRTQLHSSAQAWLRRWGGDTKEGWNKGEIERDGGGGEIISFVSSEDERDLSLIRRQIENILPTYMLPHKFIWKRELPKNSNGKIDRKKLREEFQI